MENLPEVKERIEVSMADIKKYIAPNATDKELFMFMGISKSYGLNPLKREIHFVKYGSAPASIIVGYEIYLKRAERTGKQWPELRENLHRKRPIRYRSRYKKMKKELPEKANSLILFGRGGVI